MPAAAAWLARLVFRLGLRDRDLIIRGIDLDQHRSFLTYWLSFTFSLMTWPLTRALTELMWPSTCASSVDS